MPGYGAKVVTLVDDKKVHILGEGERTECGIPIPIGSGATWTYANRGDQDISSLCSACEKVAKRVDEALGLDRALSSDEPPEPEQPLGSPEPDPPAEVEPAEEPAPKATTKKATAKK